jgi:membrane-bound inhibitor of C-type lysozyme
MHRLTWLAFFALVPCTGCQREASEPRHTAPVPSSVAPDTAVPAADTAPQPLLSWECDGGLTLTTRYLPRDRAVSLGLHEGERKLPQVPSGSGEKYQEGPITFWRKGDSAIYERTPAPQVECRLAGA